MNDNDRENVLQHVNGLFYMDLGLCGCGLPEESFDLVRSLLALAPYHQSPEVRKQVAALCGNSVAQHMILSMLDGAELIEHGGTITGAWLTDKGEWYLQVMNSISDWDEIDVGIPHNGGKCTDACWRVPVPSGTAA
ncbi:hypothetical protein OG473_39650 (plasmid) [Streptomyces anulatus]|uniref:hypothetical protein n=1 Tax=Streptomyces anulatus TaxID=1892 RepID=UPI002E0DEC6A|nr:hypothetical protein OG557_38735 [Streptomyces anulatus]